MAESTGETLNQADIQSGIDEQRLQMVEHWLPLKKSGRGQIRLADNGELIERGSDLLDLLIDGCCLHIHLLRDNICQPIHELVSLMPLLKSDVRRLGVDGVDADTIASVELRINQLVRGLCYEEQTSERHFAEIACLEQFEVLLTCLREHCLTDLTGTAALVARAAIKIVHDQTARRFPLEMEPAVTGFFLSVEELRNLEVFVPVDHTELSDWTIGEMECGDGMTTTHYANDFGLPVGT